MIKKILLSGLVCISLFSCSSDDNDTNENNNDENVEINASLVGKWSLVKSFINDVDNTDECDLKNTLEFLADGTYVDIEFLPSLADNGECKPESLEGNFKVENDKIIYDEDEPGDPDISQFSIKDGKLTTITNEDGVNTLKEVYVKNK